MNWKEMSPGELRNELRLKNLSDEDFSRLFHAARRQREDTIAELDELFGTQEPS